MLYIPKQLVISEQELGDCFINSFKINSDKQEHTSET